MHSSWSAQPPPRLSPNLHLGFLHVFFGSGARQKQNKYIVKTTNTDWNEGRTTVGAQEPITDVRNKEDAVAAATSNAVAAVSVSRVTWLG